MVTNVLRLDDRPITTLMVRRSDIVFLDVSQPLEENYRRVMASPHSAFPLCAGSLDRLLGVMTKTWREDGQLETGHLRCLARQNCISLLTIEEECGTYVRQVLRAVKPVGRDYRNQTLSCQYPLTSTDSTGAT